jgi:hypothetical protein
VVIETCVEVIIFVVVRGGGEGGSDFSVVVKFWGCGRVKVEIISEIVVVESGGSVSV